MKDKPELGMTITGRVGVNGAIDATVVEKCSFSPKCAVFEEFVGKAESFLNKVEAVAKATEGMFVLSQIHGMPYRGPNWADEFQALKQAIAKYKETKS